MKMRIFHLIFISLLTYSASQAQEKVYVAFFDCHGLPKENGYSAAFMFTDFVNDFGSFEAILAQKRDSSQEYESLSLTRESAELNSTKFYVYGEMLKLEEVYYIKVTLYATSSGLVFWKSAEQTSNAEDIPVILKEMASKMATENKLSKPGDLFLVNSAQGKKINRIRSNKRFGLITGAMLPMYEDNMDHLNPGFGGLLSFDLRNFILEGTAEIYLGKDSLNQDFSYSDVSNRYYNLGINTIYPLNTTNSAPFVCLGTGFSYRESDVSYFTTYGSAEHENFYDSGLILNGGGGYILKRNSDAALFIYGRGYIFLMDFEAPVYGVMLNLSLQIENW